MDWITLLKVKTAFLVVVKRINKGQLTAFGGAKFNIVTKSSAGSCLGGGIKNIVKGLGNYVGGGKKNISWTQGSYATTFGGLIN